MMPAKTDGLPTIVGDVSVESVTMNRKGGSMTAILNRRIRQGFEQGTRCYGASIHFGSGISCVLMVPGDINIQNEVHHSKRIRVKRISSSSYVVDLESEEEKKMVNPLTKAILAVLEEKLKAGSTTLITDSEMKEQLSESEKSAEIAAKKARQRLTKKL